MASVVIAVAALFLGGIVIGVVAVVALGVRREDRRYSLTCGEAPSGLARRVRRLNGVGLRDLDAELDSERLRPARELVH
jgi:hypothetical protein